MIRCFLLSGVFIAGCFMASGQTDTSRSSFSLSISEHVGKLIKIHGEYPANEISSLTELNFSRKTTGKQDWHRVYKYPAYGFSLVHAQFGNPQVLGQSIAAIPVMRFERIQKKSRFTIQAGFGIAWFNKPYHHLTNPENLVIGSSLANMSMAKLECSKSLSTQFRYSFGCSFTHCSNAHVAVPNIGANIVALHAGLSWSGAPFKDLNSLPKSKSRLPRTWALGMFAHSGIQEVPGTIKPVNGIIYPVFGAGIQAVFHSAVGKDFHAGIHCIYYPLYKEYIVSQELFPDQVNERRKAQSVVLFLGYEWKFNRIALFVQGGIKLYDPFTHAINDVWDLPKHGFLYQWTSNKLGYRYYVLKDEKKFSPYIQLAVKTNGGTADYLETGVGFLLK